MTPSIGLQLKKPRARDKAVGLGLLLSWNNAGTVDGPGHSCDHVGSHKANTNDHRDIERELKREKKGGEKINEAPLALGREAGHKHRPF